MLTLFAGCTNVSAFGFNGLGNRGNSNALIQREVNVGPMSIHANGLLGLRSCRVIPRLRGERMIDFNPSNNVQDGVRNVQVNMLGASGTQRGGLWNTQIDAFGGNGEQRGGKLSSMQLNILGGSGEQRLNTGLRVGQHNFVGKGTQKLNAAGMLNQGNILSSGKQTLNAALEMGQGNVLSRDKQTLNIAGLQLYGSDLSLDTRIGNTGLAHIQRTNDLFHGIELLELGKSSLILNPFCGNIWYGS